MKITRLQQLLCGGFIKAIKTALCPAKSGGQSHRTHFDAWLFNKYGGLLTEPF